MSESARPVQERPQVSDAAQSSRLERIYRLRDQLREAEDEILDGLERLVAWRRRNSDSPSD